MSLPRRPGTPSSADVAQGWNCQLSDGHFWAVKELLLLAVRRATDLHYSNPKPHSSHLVTVLQALEISAKLHRVDDAGCRDYVQRHIGALSIWGDIRWGE